ncbi:hypothetical protein M5778_003691 [Salmonella enterica]|nr:hypothetical protein [Salmonella enterica]EJE9711565.1 hypothetical protein [Salmonella enterica]
MTTNNYPAHGPVSLYRLHQISEILSKAAAQSDGGNLGYAMADAVKVIDELLEARKVEPVAFIGERMLEDVTDGARSCGRIWSDGTDEISGERRIPLYTAPPAPVVPEALPENDSEDGNDIDYLEPSQVYELGRVTGWNACRAAMLQVGNPPVIPDGYVLVPNRLTAENGAKGVLSGEFSETKFINCPECFGDDECETCDGSGRIEITVPVTWTTIKAIWAKGVEHFEAAPQQEVK